MTTRGRPRDADIGTGAGPAGVGPAGAPPLPPVVRAYRWLKRRVPAIQRLALAYARIRGGSRRYRYLEQVVTERGARRILEIGTWDGTHGIAMIRAAATRVPVHTVEYYGFDLFELLDRETARRELSFTDAPPPMEVVREKLEATGARIRLFRGDTKETLPRVVSRLPTMDVIYIDGGHSLETVASDWRYAERLMDDRTVVLFDDYYPDLDGVGCKRLVEEIDRERFAVTVLPVEDRFYNDWGVLRIRFAKVTRARSA